MRHSFCKRAWVLGVMLSGMVVTQATPALAAADVPAPPNTDTWFPWNADSDTARPSVIDMSGWLDKPAGAHGRITRKNDKLIYNGKPLKIWGINVNYGACAPSHDLADRQAKFYAKYGINAVRLHKWADGTGWQGILTKDSFIEFDPAKLDDMDYYIHQLKEQGIYNKLSPVFGSARIGVADVKRVPFADEFGKAREGWITAPQGATYFSVELQDLHIEQLTKLLNHKNPHTGLRYADDPAIFCVELVNENSITFFGLGAMQKSPTIKKLAGKAFFAWLKKKYGSEQALTRAWGDGVINSFAAEKMTGEGWDEGEIYPVGNAWFFDPAQLEGAMKPRKQRLLDTIAFYYDQQNAFYARYAKAIRDTGYAGEITASNWQAGRAFGHYANLASDAQIGIIDRHNYFSGAGSMLANPGSGMLSAGLQQLSDRPFMLSEWIHVFPNEYGVEGPAILGAYGLGLNGWDASFAFQNGDSGRFRRELKEEWDVISPQVLGVFPAVVREIYREDVKESEVAFTRNVDLDSIFKGKLGFEDRVQQGYDVKEFNSDATPAAALAVGRTVVEFNDSFKPTAKTDLRKYVKNGTLDSTTGQLEWCGGEFPQSGYFTINSPGTQAVIGFADGKKIALNDVELSQNAPFAAVYVTALDRGATIANGKSLLVTTIARVRNTGMRMVDGKMVSRGKPPMLVEPIAVDLFLKRMGNVVVHVLDHDGRRTGKMLPIDNGAVRLDGAQTQAVYYEIEYR